ncbi:Outer envelope pore protein 37, chloroplastic [Heracleum sosnowskyi]|uniref:Outer envelope pore protein 37, chloroplastic n=1 Tax=Heracleum sosnowskyi TaxID=360622 RepID=A0AAD8JBN1_9APIA|nr:Outer envelope pore protein 37, chloroplastic [Heracleum sosnowskyi]
MESTTTTLTPQPKTPTPVETRTPMWWSSPVRVTSEFDSVSSMCFHKISTKFMDNLVKFKLSFQNDSNGQVNDPHISFISKNLSLDYDVEERNALVKANLQLSPSLHLTATRDIKAQQGELAVVADLASTAYKFQLSSALPSVGLPRATLKFPIGEVSLEEKEETEDDVKKVLSINGTLKGQLLSGVCTASYQDENLNMRYLYKDELMSFIPSISLPSNTLSLAFKRRYSPSDKLSYFYNFNSNFWSVVYKHKVGKDYKFKAGYDSEVQLGWASFWVGDEAGKAKAAPKKMKFQLMLQVPRDDIKTSTLMFRLKKRWDF